MRYRETRSLVKKNPFWRRGLRLIREHGWREFCQRSFLKGQRLFYEASELIWVELNMDDLRPRYSLCKGAIVEEVNDANFHKFVEFRNEYPHPAKIFDDVRRKGFKTFMVLAEGRAVGVTILGTEDYYFQEVRLNVHVNRNEVFVYGIWVLPEQRRRMATGTLVESSLLDFKERGYQRAIGLIFSGNMPSLRLAQRLGLKEGTRIKTRRFLFYQKRLDCGMISQATDEKG